MFERFTEQARSVVVYAQEESRLLGHSHLGTEHLLLGLLRIEDGLAAIALRSFDVSLDAARAEVEQTVDDEDDTDLTAQIPFTPRAKQTLNTSIQESLALGHRYIGTEHILLGLASQSDSVGMRILSGFGAEPEAIRSRVMELIGSPPASPMRQAFPGEPLVIELAGDDIGEIEGRPAYFGMPVPIRAVIVHTEEIAAVVIGMVAYPDHLEFDLVIRSRQREGLGNLRATPGASSLPVDLDPARERTPFQFSIVDGNGLEVALDPSFASTRSDPSLTVLQASGGGHLAEQSLFYQPLPPPGPLTFVFAWPGGGIPESRATIDTAEIHAAAEQAIKLWR